MSFCPQVYLGGIGMKDFKVKIFNSGDIDELEHDINRFVKNLEVIDIKIVSHRYSCTVMIMYKNN